MVGMLKSGKWMLWILISVLLLSGCAMPSVGGEDPYVPVELTGINPEGITLETRFTPPEGFARLEFGADAFGTFVRNYPLKEDGAPVLLYNGTRKPYQSFHAAVFALPIEKADLQQCADSVMRMYAEYYWAIGQPEKLAFHFTNGFLCDYARWRDGYRVKVRLNEAKWSKDADFDDSHETFVKYLRQVFNYAGTLSMATYETETVALEEMTVGDVILNGGSPGHVVMVVDVCENEDGQRAWLLAQGYMPAQEFHVIRNPKHEADPWYYESEMEFPLKTAEYTFADTHMICRVTY